MKCYYIKSTYDDNVSGCYIASSMHQALSVFEESMIDDLGVRGSADEETERLDIRDSIESCTYVAELGGIAVHPTLFKYIQGVLPDEFVD